MKNLYLLPTDKPSRLVKNNLGLIRVADNFTKSDLDFILAEFVNIYITSDEEIKDVRPHKGKWQLETGQILNKFPNYLTDLSECKLVIMTTDEDLIKDGVQAIDDEFLEWLVENPSCKVVEVVKTAPIRPFGSLYKIIIPNEEVLLQSSIDGEPIWGEPKQETLEEAYLNKLIDDANKEFRLDRKLAKEVAMKFSKWQQERSYSEEEVLNFTQTMIMQYKFGNTNIEQMDSLKESLEQFKNK